MFERYTEKARRVIFFARYEATNYGSPYIGTEHMLLGLVREDRTLARRCFGLRRFRSQIRAEIEKAVTRGDKLLTSVEVPLSTESQQMLRFAKEEANRLGNKHIGTEHMLLALTRLPESFGARVLLAKGVKFEVLREKIEKIADSFAAEAPGAEGPWTEPDIFIRDFLGALNGDGSERPTDFFDEAAQFVDSSGKRWIGRKELERSAEILFAPFARKNAAFRVEDVDTGSAETVIASVFWEFASVAGNYSKSMLRMSIVLALVENDWAIVLVQATPLLPSRASIDAATP